MLSEEKEPFNEQGCWVWTCSRTVPGCVLELPLEWAEPSDRRELLAGELEELAALSPWLQKRKKKCEPVWVTDSHTLLQLSKNWCHYGVFQHKIGLSDWKFSYHPTIPTHTPFFSALVVLRLFLSCCTIGLSSFPAFSLCLLVLRRRPVGGTAWSRLTLGGRDFPSSLYRRSISLLWNACSSEISFMCLLTSHRKRTKK